MRIPTHARSPEKLQFDTEERTNEPMTAASRPNQTSYTPQSGSILRLLKVAVGRVPLTIPTARRVIFAAAITCATMTAQTNARAQYYPTCEQQYTSSSAGPCSMPDGNGDAGMLGTVNVYLIWMGNWTSSAIDQATQTLVPTFVQGLNDSAYSAIWATYNSNWGAPSGKVQLGQHFIDPYEWGGQLNDNDAQDEILWVISNGIKNDINGVYVLLPHSEIQVAPPTQDGAYCTSVCAYNANQSLDGTNNIKYVVLPQNTNCGGCQWGFETPNTAGGQDTKGRIDGEISLLAHELSEAITDPNAPYGWYNGNSGFNTQIADYCQGTGLTAEGAWYNVGAARANAHLNGNDFLIQALRANESNGQWGYCANDYGGLFWKQDFGFSWNPVPSDWSPNSYKGECQRGQPLIGLSIFTANGNRASGPAHTVLCDTGSNWTKGTPTYFNSFEQSRACYFRAFDPGDNRGYTGQGDWDYGFYKAQCGTSEFVAGISQSQAGVTNGILCCPGSIHSQDACEAEVIGASPIPATDWDWGYLKAQCQTPGQYVAGVSAIPGGNNAGTPHAILCCQYEY
jgi:hypothetical protein